MDEICCELCCMNKITYIKHLIYVGASIIVFKTGAFAQNSLGIQNLDILNIAKQIDPAKLRFVEVDQGKLIANPGFKFVQLRDTETFILVPDSFRDRVVDMSSFLAQNSRDKIVLDTRKLTAKLICQSSPGLRTHCRHIRLAKNIVSCKNCRNMKWISASVLSDIGIIIPPYKSR